MPSLTSWTAFIPEKGGWGGASTPLNLIFVDSCICAICGWCFCFVLIFLRFFFSFLLKIDT